MKNDEAIRLTKNFDELLDVQNGKVGTQERDAFEEKAQYFVISELLKDARKGANSKTDNEIRPSLPRRRCGTGFGGRLGCPPRIFCGDRQSNLTTNTRLACEIASAQSGLAKTIGESLLPTTKAQRHNAMTAETIRSHKPLSLSQPLFISLKKLLRTHSR